MSRLLSAGFARLMKNRIFHIALFFMIGLVIFEVALSIYDSRSRTDVVIAPIDVYLHEDMLFLGFIAAIFIGLFIGVEYSDGTIRNKLMVGHTRAAVYASNLIVCVSAGIILHLVYLITLFGASLIFFREYFSSFLPGFLDLLRLQGIDCLIIVAYSSIFCLNSMTISSKASGVVVSIIIALVLLFGGIYVRMAVNAYYDEEVLAMAEDMISDGDMSDETDQENVADNDANLEAELVEYDGSELALTGARLKVYQCMDEFLPSCQVFHLPDWNLSEHVVHYLLYDGWIVIVTNVFGIWLFHKKDLK